MMQAIMGAISSQSGPLINTVWTITTSQTWVVPVNGLYDIEIHGGGGSGYPDWTSQYGAHATGAPGGGSGSLYSNVSLVSGIGYSITVGGAGESSSFGALYTQVPGGSASPDYIYYYTIPGESRGNIAGNAQGNMNAPAQTYGDGGPGSPAGGVGQPGAIIITLRAYT